MADIMNRGDVLSTIAAETDLSTAKVDAVLKAFEGAIGRALSAGGEVRIAGFGTFKTSKRAARTSRNPRTGEPVPVPERTAARFVPGKGLKSAAEGNGGGATQGTVQKDGKARADTKAAQGSGAKGAAAKGATAKAGAPKASDAKGAAAKSKADESKSKGAAKKKK